MSETPDASRPSPTWRWRRHTGPGWPAWRATVPGPVGDDGGTVYLGRRDAVRGRCTTCGRRAQRWQASLALPQPFPPALDLPGGGCTRDHIATTIPTTWAAVAAIYAATADEFRHLQADRLVRVLACRRVRQARWAEWLDGQPPPARQLALTLWTRDPHLTPPETTAIIAAVLSDPDHLCRPETVPVGRHE
ncbi:hypothetical protein [Geodermatophilus sp. SYSU D00684]